MHYGVKGGEIVGDRLRGTLRGGSQWALNGPDGCPRVDVRLQCEKHDGAYGYVQYNGVPGLNEAVQGARASSAAYSQHPST